MSKLNKIISCLIPITTICALAPVMVGCGKPAWDFKYGDSINCYNNTPEYTDIAPYQPIATVYAASKLHADKHPGGIVTKEDINKNISLESAYFDLIASLCMANTIFCVKSQLNDTYDTFTTLQITQEENIQNFDNSDVSAFSYTIKPDTTIGCLTITNSASGGNLSIPSYIYSECKVVEG